jgi:hypothetical protein
MPLCAFYSWTPTWPLKSLKRHLAELPGKKCILENDMSPSSFWCIRTANLNVSEWQKIRSCEALNNVDLTGNQYEVRSRGWRGDSERWQRGTMQQPCTSSRYK